MYRVINAYDVELFVSDDYHQALDCAAACSEGATMAVYADGRVVALAVDGRIVE